MEKNGLRKQFKNRIGLISDKDKKNQSQILLHKIAEFLQRQMGLWTLYSPLNDEPNILNLFTQCQHIQWAFPRVESKTEIRFHRVQSLDQMVSSTWGIDELASHDNAPVEKETINGCLVPGMAYDFFGTRLGRGGGYYDRFLKNFNGLKLGVIFNEGLTNEALPYESHDQRMDIVVSPNNWIEVSKCEVRNEF